MSKDGDEEPNGERIAGSVTPDDVGPPSRHRVTYGPAAVVVGFLVGLTLLALAFTVTWGPGSGAGIFVMALLYGSLIGASTALPLGIAIGLLLRPVRNQWVHVGAFFAVFTAAAFLIATALSPSTAIAENLPVALLMGGVASVARASIWKLVRVQ